jgi:hypothetical protein
MFGNGTQLHMPAKSWLDQALVRTLILHLTGDAVPERTDDEWLDVVLALHDAAEQA